MLGGEHAAELDEAVGAVDEGAEEVVALGERQNEFVVLV